jgi:hypothetical protein
VSASEPGAGTPLLDFFKRGNVDREIRLMAARGELGLRPHEHAGMLELLVNDPDSEVAKAAKDSLGGGETAAAPAEPAGNVAEADADGAEDQPDRNTIERIAAMNPAQKLQTAMRGTREERAILVRDANRLVAMAVLSSPKISESEVETIAKMTNVSEDILRAIGQTRAWAKNYAIISALARNSKTPIGVSLTLLSRLMEKDIKSLTTDRNIPDVVRLAARKRLTPSK